MFWTVVGAPHNTMSKTSSKNKEIRAYGLEADKLRAMYGAFSPYLMMTVRLSAALLRTPELKDQFDADDLEAIALLHEHFYRLMIIRDRYRPDRELDDSEMNQARQILNQMCPLTDADREVLRKKLDAAVSE